MIWGVVANLITAALSPVMHSSDGKTTISYHGILYRKLDDRHARWVFTKGIDAEFLTQRIRVSADHASCNSVTEKNTTQIDNLDALGQVRLRQNQANGIVNGLESEEIVYTAHPKGSEAKSPGKVILNQTNSAKRSVFRAIGNSGDAQFLLLGKQDSKMSQATLNGSVELDLVEAAQAGHKPTTAHVTCDNLVYKPLGVSGTLVLTGDIQFKGSQFNLSNAHRIVIHLNGKGEFKDLQENEA